MVLRENFRQSTTSDHYNAQVEKFCHESGAGKWFKAALTKWFNDSPAIIKNVNVMQQNSQISKRFIYFSFFKFIVTDVNADNHTLYSKRYSALLLLQNDNKNNPRCILMSHYLYSRSHRELPMAADHKLGSNNRLTRLCRNSLMKA